MYRMFYFVRHIQFNVLKSEVNLLFVPYRGRSLTSQGSCGSSVRKKTRLILLINQLNAQNLVL